MTCVILVPVLNRPHRVAPLLADIAAATPEDHSVLFVADPDDHAELEAIRAAGGEVIIQGGSYAKKINAGVRTTNEPWVFFGADDLHFHPGWLREALKAGVRANGCGVIGTNDLGNRRVVAGNHATHSLVARWYAEQGAIDGGGPLHEGYSHNFVDDEFVETAKHRLNWTFAPDSIVEHLHPDWGKGEHDKTYDKGRSTFREDRAYFHRQRRPLWT
ncbi:MAG: glycosyltransferase family 2 protein [Solirubrobacteraceae bacterium]